MAPTITALRTLACVLGLGLAAAFPVRAYLAQAPEAINAPELSAAHRYFTDVVLINQDGEPMRLYSDLLQGKTVIINSFFTSCKAGCPALTATLRKIQKSLGKRLGTDVHILSLTVDPEHDTPKVLKTYAERVGAGKGWYFLSGSKENMDLALKKFGQLVKSREAHQSIVVIGNEPTGLWKKALGFASPKDLIAVVNSVLNDQLSSTDPVE